MELTWEKTENKVLYVLMESAYFLILILGINIEMFSITL